MLKCLPFTLPFIHTQQYMLHVRRCTYQFCLHVYCAWLMPSTCLHCKICFHFCVGQAPQHFGGGGGCTPKEIVERMLREVLSYVSTPDRLRLTRALNPSSLWRLVRFRPCTTSRPLRRQFFELTWHPHSGWMTTLTTHGLHLTTHNN